MKILFKLLVLCALLGFAAQAHALLITPGTVPQWTGNENDQNAIDVAIAPIIGAALELYKNDVGELDEGILKDSYDTEFSNTPGDPEDATITWSGPGVVGPTAWLLVKDGDQVPAWYLFNLTTLSWDGMDTLELTGFWPTQGAISHVTLYGSNESTPNPIPEPATMLLLGSGLIGLAGLGRKKFWRV